MVEAHGQIHKMQGDHTVRGLST